MRRLLTIPVLVLLLSGHVVAAPTRFAYVDVYVDSADRPLAAYQLELKADAGDVKIVGIEGGEHAAFKPAPYYDKAAMSGDRVILAAFNTGNDLPKGKTRVARVMVQVTGDAKPEYRFTLTTAATTGGEKIPAVVSIVQRGEEP